MTTKEATELFDSLEPASVVEMLGQWRGEGIGTDHPMDGMLEASYWYGKNFKGPDAVYPLWHKSPIWGDCYVNPSRLPLKLTTHLPFRNELGPFIFPLLVPFIRTNKPKARLREILFRGRYHAAMCYDTKPINDVFAHIDDKSIMGWMDFKGMDKPYFFKLYREQV